MTLNQYHIYRVQKDLAAYGYDPTYESVLVRLDAREHYSAMEAVLRTMGARGHNLDDLYVVVPK